jgi:hypothetical protein
MWLSSSAGFRCARQVALIAGLSSAGSVVSAGYRDFRCQIRCQLFGKARVVFYIACYATLFYTRVM